jgi:hypothetical protein
LRSEPAKIAIALLIASGVTLFDRALFQSDWFYMGLVQQIQQSLRTEPTRQEKFRLWGRYFLRIFFRLGISLLIAFTLSLFAEVAVFGDAITEKIDAKFNSENAEYYKKLQDQTKAVDQKIATADSRIAQIAIQLSDREQRNKFLMSDDDRRIYERDWEKIKENQNQINSIEPRIKENDRAIRAWSDDIQAEINGVKLKPEHTGLPGCGPHTVCETKKGMIENAKTENRALKAQQSDLTKEIQQLEQRTISFAEKYDTADKSFVEERERERVSLQREIVLLQTGRAAQLDEAERELKRSGIFRNRRDDPIIRVRYLKELKNEPERGDVVSQMSLMIRLFIMFLEIAPVVAKMFFAPPSAYAWKIQAEVGKQQLEALVQLDRQIDEYQLQHVANAKNLDELIQERQDTKERARVWDEAAKAAFESVARGRQSDQSST